MILLNSYLGVIKFRRLSPFGRYASGMLGSIKLPLCFAMALFVCVSVPSVSAQSRDAQKLYGAYPITGASELVLLKKAMNRDRREVRANKDLCVDTATAKRMRQCDIDHDGISKGMERKLGTRPRSMDTDGDRLSDRYELMKSHTNPLVADTDGDGISDGDEVLDGGSDPTDSESPNPGGACEVPNYDTSGNTTEFGIPQSFVGNVTIGQQAYAQRCSNCHINIDKGTTLNFLALDKRLKQAPMLITLDTQTLADIVAYLHRAEAVGAGPCATPTPSEDPTPSPTPTPIATPTGPGCVNQYFDIDGNTTQFGIANALIGNIARGITFYASNCSSCHGERGAGMTYSQMKAAVEGPLMNIHTVTNPQYADLTAFANRSLANVGCGGGNTPTPTPTSTNSPTPTPTPYNGQCSNQYFDTSGHTSSFGIPSPLTGGINQGSSLYGLACSGCHGDRGANWTYTQIRTAVMGPLMNINTVTNQQYADITAYLNRSSAPQNCGPIPTPTPISNAAAGQIVYDATCKSCHSHPTEFRTMSLNKLHEAIREKQQMRNISLTTQQETVLLIYLHGL